MSIRDFNNIPCPTCGKDTLHIAFKCTVCGDFVVSPFLQRREATKRLWRTPIRMKRALDRKAYAAAAIAKERWENRKTTKPDVYRTSTFGKGRERTR